MNIPIIPFGFVMLALVVLLGISAYLSWAALNRIKGPKRRKRARHWQVWCWVFGPVTGILIPISGAGLVLRPQITSGDSWLCLIPLAFLAIYCAATLWASDLVVNEAGRQVRSQVGWYQYASAGSLILTGMVLTVLPISAFCTL